MQKEDQHSKGAFMLDSWRQRYSLREHRETKVLTIIFNLTLQQIVNIVNIKPEAIRALFPPTFMYI